MLPNQAIVKTWSPDGTKVLFASREAHQLFEADPVTGAYSELPWTSELPDWQRRGVVPRSSAGTIRPVGSLPIPGP